MSKTPFLPFFVGDFVADVMELSTEEIGAYILLLSRSWTAGGYLPHDTRKLARICKVTPTRFRKRLWPEIQGYFQIEEGVVWNQRLVEELDKARINSGKRAIAGRLGGLASAASRRATQSDLPQDPKRFRLLDAMGVAATPLGEDGHIYGNQTDMLEADRWSKDLSLTIDEQCNIIREVMAGYKGRSPPKYFRYFSQAMERYRAAKDRPAPTVRANPPHNGNSHGSGLRTPAAHAKTAFRDGFLQPSDETDADIEP